MTAPGAGLGRPATVLRRLPFLASRPRIARSWWLASSALCGGAAGLCAIDWIDLAWVEAEAGWSLRWDSTPGLYYAIEKNHEAGVWSDLENGILAESTALETALPEPGDLPVYYRVRENGFVDPATPASAAPSLTVPTGDIWVLEFSDEFNTFNTTKWNVTVSTKTRAPRPDKGIQQWFWREENVSVADGKLVLGVTKPNATTMHCASVDSKNRYEPKYGFMEARLQIAPVVNAIHTAFWIQGHHQGQVDGSGADGSEVDIVETPWADERGQTVLHWDGYGAQKKAQTNRWSAPGLHTGYHTFAMHWTDTFIDIYYDGDLRWRYEGVGLPQVREWLWLSVGASFGDGDFQNGTYPSFAYIDYVRVWQAKTPEPTPSVVSGN